MLELNAHANTKGKFPLSAFEDLQAICKKQNVKEAIQRLFSMQQEGIPLPEDIVCSVIENCTRKRDIISGKKLQLLLLNDELNPPTSVVGDHLIRFFASSNNLQDANKVFSSISKPTVYTWNAIITAHSNLNGNKEALQLYEQMLHSGINPDKFTFLPVLRVCCSATTISKGRLIHDQIIRSVLELDASIRNALMNMYMKCGNIKEGENLFISSPNRDLVSWGAMISGYTQHGYGLMALKCFEKIPVGLVLNTVIYSCVFKACGSIGALVEGRLVYDEILRSKLELDVGMANHLVDMYVKCSSLEEAVRMLESWPKRDIVSWGILIAGFAECKNVPGALQLLEKMWQQDGLKPDRVIFMSLFQACSNTETAEQGKIVHDLMVRSGLNLDIMVGSTLVDMYAKSENLDEACNVHKTLPYRDARSWAILISGYSQHGCPHLALDCFEKMLKDGIEPDSHVFSCTLKSCASASALQNGRLLHIQIIKHGLKIDAILGGSLVDMYAKCRNLVEGWDTLNTIHPQDIVSWNALISGYAQHCEYALAQECLQAMQAQGLKPDSTTYISILAACSHVGTVEDGHWYFTSMVRDHITPNVEHFNCMIDLLGRSGYLNDALKLLRSMPIVINTTGWTSLLAACRKFGNLNLAKECFHQIMQLDPDNAAAFILMSNCYADFGLWEHVQKLCKLRNGNSNTTWKNKKYWIECDDIYHI